MKLQCIKVLLANLIVAALVTMSPTETLAGNGEDASNAGMVLIDHGGSLAGSVESIAEKLGEALDKNATGDQVDALVDALSKVKVKGADKAGKVASLGKIKGVAGFLSKAVKALKYGPSAGKLIAAAQNRDRAAFQQVVADTLTSMAADFIAGQISGLLYKHATGSLAAGLVTGGSSLILAGVEFAAGLLIDQFAGDIIKDGLQGSFVQGLLLDLGGLIYDTMFGNEDGQDPGNGQVSPPGDDPGGGDHPGFETPPESGDGKPGTEDRYQGLKALRLID